MITPSDVFAVTLGFLHGFVVWKSSFTVVQPLVEHSMLGQTNLPVSKSIAQIIVTLFLLVCGFALLGVFGQMIDSSPSKELKGLLFMSSFVGLLCSGAFPRIEAALRGR